MTDPLLARVFGSLERRARPSFLSWGHFVARNQIATLLGVCIVVCLTLSGPTAALVAVSWRFGTSSSLWTFFSRPHLRPDGAGLRHLALYHGEPCWSRSEKQRHLLIDHVWITSEAHLAGTSAEHGALVRSTLHGALQMHRNVMSSLDKDEASACIRDATGRCASISALHAWEANENALLSDPDLLSTLAGIQGSYSKGGLPYMEPWTLPGFKKHSPDQLASADFIGLLVLREAKSMSNMTFLFHEALPDNSYTLGEMPHGEYARIVVRTDPLEVFGDPHARLEHSGLALVYFIVGFYVYIRLRRLTRIHSRPGLIFTGLIEMLMSGLLSLRLCSTMGLRLDLVPWQFMPFLVVVLGVDNIFLLSQAISATSFELSLPERIAEGFASVGFPLLLTLLGELGFFGTAFLMAPSGSSWKETSGFVFVALIVDYVLQSTFFLTVLSIDTQRLEMAEVLTQVVTWTPARTTARRRSQKQDQLPLKTSLGFLWLGISSAMSARLVRNYTLIFLLILNLGFQIWQGPRLMPDLCGPRQSSWVLPTDWTSSERLFWKVLNPDNVAQLHISITAPLVVALQASGMERFRSVPARLLPKGRPPWPISIVLPTSVIAFALYRLLVFLIKDAELLAAEKGRAAKRRLEEANAEKERVARPRALVEGITPLAELDIELMAVGAKILVTWSAFEAALTVSRLSEFFDVPTGRIEVLSRIALQSAAPVLAISVCQNGKSIVAYSTDGTFHFFSVETASKTGSLPSTVSSRVIAICPRPCRAVTLSPPRHGATDDPASFIVLYANGALHQLQPSLHKDTEMLLPASSATATSRRALLCGRVRSDASEPCFVLQAETLTQSALFIVDHAVAAKAGTLSVEAGVTAASAGVVPFGGQETLLVVTWSRKGRVELHDGRSGANLATLHDSDAAGIKSIRMSPGGSQACHRCGHEMADCVLLAYNAGSQLLIKQLYQPSSDAACRCTIASTPSAPLTDDPFSTPTKKSLGDDLVATVPTHSTRRASFLRDRRDPEIEGSKSRPLSPASPQPSTSVQTSYTVRAHTLAELSIGAVNSWQLNRWFAMAIRRRKDYIPPDVKHQDAFAGWELVSVSLSGAAGDRLLPICEPLRQHSMTAVNAKGDNVDTLRRRRDPFVDANAVVRSSSHTQLPFSRGRHFLVMSNDHAVVALGGSVAIIDASASGWHMNGSSIPHHDSTPSDSPLRGRKAR